VSGKFKFKIPRCKTTSGHVTLVKWSKEGDGNGGSCVMCQVTLKALRTYTKCEGGRYMLALDVLNCPGFQVGLNKVQFEVLGDSVHYFCFYCESKIQSPKEK